jgi:hypothetical protein
MPRNSLAICATEFELQNLDHFRWDIIRHPARTWSLEAIWEMMTTSVIMHNIVEQGLDDACLHDQRWQFQGESVQLQPRAST